MCTGFRNSVSKPAQLEPTTWDLGATMKQQENQKKKVKLRRDIKQENFPQLAINDKTIRDKTSQLAGWSARIGKTPTLNQHICARTVQFKIYKKGEFFFLFFSPVWFEQSRYPRVLIQRGRIQASVRTTYAGSFSLRAGEHQYVYGLYCSALEHNNQHLKLPINFHGFYTNKFLGRWVLAGN